MTGQITPNVSVTEITTSIDSDNYVAGCTEITISMNVCNNQYETDSIVNFFFGPENAFITQFYENPEGPAEGDFTAFGLNNVYLIGSMNTFGVENACQDIEFNIGTAPFPGGSTADGFVFQAWNASTPPCNDPYEGIGNCAFGDASCVPCAGTLCDEICPVTVIDISLPGNKATLISNTDDNLISDIFQNQVPIVFDGSSSADDGPCDNPPANYFIQEDLLVDEDWCVFRNNPNDKRRVILFDAGKKIIIPNGVTANFNDLAFESCSDIFWDAIEVQNGGTLIMRDCDIKEGRNAIRAENGATLSINNCNFTDNYVGIYMGGIDNIFYIEGINLILRGNTFSGTGELVAPYSGQSPLPSDLPYAGIQLRNVKFVDVSSFGDNATNYFDNMYNGIVSSNSTFVVGGAQFSNMIRPNDTNGLSGYGIFANNKGFFYNYMQLQPSLTESLFTNMPVGISMRNMGGTIDEAIMQDVNTGVEIQNCKQKRVVIKNSNIQANNFGISTINNTPLFGRMIDNTITVQSQNTNSTSFVASAGINCSENTSNGGPGWNIKNNIVQLVNGDAGIVYRYGGNANISNNNILRTGGGKKSYTLVDIINSPNTVLSCNNIGTLLPTSNGLSASRGVYVQDSPSMLISCNHIESVEDGVSFDGVCSATDFKANTMSNGIIGLSLSAEAVISEQGHKGNCFNGNNDAEAAHASTNEFFIDRSKFTVKCGADQNALSCICPDLADIDTGTGDPTDFFNQVTFGTTASCEEEDGDCPGVEGYRPPQEPNDNISRSIAQGNLIYNRTDAQYDRMLEYDLFTNLAALENPIQNNHLANFYQGHLQSNLANMYNANGSAVTIQNHEVLVNDLSIELENLKALNTSWENQEIDEATYIQNKHNIIQNINNAMGGLNSAYNTYKQDLTNELGDQNASLANIVEDRIYDTNMKWILAKDITAKSPMFTGFSETEWADIYNLALQCAEDAGHAVYIARSLYNSKVWTDFEALQSCVNLQPRTEKQDSQVSTAVLSPNPTTGFIDVN